MNGVELVVDASLALKWLMEELYSAETTELLEKWRRHGQRLIAPALFLYEVTNAIAKRMQRRQLTLEQGKEGLEFFPRGRAHSDAAGRSARPRPGTHGAIQNASRL